MEIKQWLQDKLDTGEFLAPVESLYVDTKGTLYIQGLSERIEVLNNNLIIPVELYDINGDTYEDSILYPLTKVVPDYSILECFYEESATMRNPLGFEFTSGIHYNPEVIVGFKVVLESRV